MTEHLILDFGLYINVFCPFIYILKDLLSKYIAPDRKAYPNIYLISQ